MFSFFACMIEKIINFTALYMVVTQSDYEIYFLYYSHIDSF